MSFVQSAEIECYGLWSKTFSLLNWYFIPSTSPFMQCLIREAMGIVHSKLFTGNPYGSGRGIIDVGRGAYRYVD